MNVNWRMEPLNEAQKTQLRKEYAELPRHPATGQIVCGYLTALAEKWGISKTRIHRLVTEGR